MNYLNEIEFKGKNLLISGSTSGIGLSTVECLFGAEANCFLMGRDFTRLNLKLQKVGKPKCNLELLEGDICDDNYLEIVSQRVESLDGIVLSAGIIDYIPIKQLNRKRCFKMFDINVISNIVLLQKLIIKRKISNHCSIILISSISNNFGIPGTAIYASSKAALNGFARVLAIELAQRKVRVNIISPGIIKNSALLNNKSIVRESLLRDEITYPLGYLTEEDVVNKILFLLSTASGGMTGAELIVDGGFSLI